MFQVASYLHLSAFGTSDRRTLGSWTPIRSHSLLVFIGTLNWALSSPTTSSFEIHTVLYQPKDLEFCAACFVIHSPLPHSTASTKSGTHPLPANWTLREQYHTDEAITLLILLSPLVRICACKRAWLTPSADSCSYSSYIWNTIFIIEHIAALVNIESSTLILFYSCVAPPTPGQCRMTPEQHGRIAFWESQGGSLAWSGEKK